MQQLWHYINEPAFTNIVSASEAELLGDKMNTLKIKCQLLTCPIQETQISNLKSQKRYKKTQIKPRHKKLSSLAV